MYDMLQGLVYFMGLIIGFIVGYTARKQFFEEKHDD
jgi:uncharacterized membrane protein (Fun14 family)